MTGDERGAKKAYRNKLQSSLKVTPGLLNEMYSDLRYEGQVMLTRRRNSRQEEYANKRNQHPRRTFQRPDRTWHERNKEYQDA